MFRGEKAGEAEGIARGEIVGEDVDGAVCSLGEGFAQRDADALGTGREMHKRFEVLARIPHTPFPGGRWWRRPALVAAMGWYRLRDWIG